MKIKFIHIIFTIFISLKILAVVYTNYINGFNISSITSSNIFSDSNNFISNDSIFNILISSKLISDSTSVESIDLNKIESKVLEIPYIDKVSSSIDIQSNFSLEIVEKKPIIDIKDYDFYLSEKGERIPRIENKKLNIKSFFGKIDSIVFCDLASLAKYINNDNFFIEHIKYIYADSTSFYFSVNDYKYQVKLGNLNNYENKLKKYKGFYAAKVNTDLLKNFNKLDLNFNNQVIAQKNNMENNELYIGLDIGTTKIVAMIGVVNEYDKLKIVGIGKSKSLGVHRGVVNNITQTIQSIQSAVEEAELNSSHKIDKVVVGIAGQHIRSLQHSDYVTRENSDQVIDKEDIDRLINQVYKLVMLPGEEIIHVLPQDYKVDGQGEIKEPIGMFGSRVEANFHVVVGQVSSIKNIARCVKSAGIDFEGITLEPLASADAVLSREEKEAGVALIDIGGGTTDLAIFKDGIIRHTAVIPFGGNIITDDIKEGCSIIEKQAELLKIKFGSAWPGENKENEIVSIPGLRGRDPKEITLKNLSKIINARIVEIIEQVFIEIKNYGHDEQKKKLIAGIVLTGGGSQLNHLKQTVEYVTGMDTRIGQPNEHLAGNNSIEISNPTFATAVGLVMNSMNRKKIDKKDDDENQNESSDEESVTNNENTDFSKTVFEKFTDKIKNFLENAE